ncbi:fumarate hydratase, partial [Rhizobium ruizarguesonis]
MADDLFPLGKDATPYHKISGDHVSVYTFTGQEILTVEQEGIRLLAETAFADIHHLLRPGHPKQLASLLYAPEANDN